MTPQPWQARMRIARQTGDAMLRRLGLCRDGERKEGTRHLVAADMAPALTSGIAPTGTRVPPAEAECGRPGTAGTQRMAP
jgi:hypothetical protein